MSSTFSVPVDGRAVFIRQSDGHVWDDTNTQFEAAPSSGAWSSDNLISPTQTGGLADYVYTVPTGVQSVDWRALIYDTTAPAVGDTPYAQADGYANGRTPASVEEVTSDGQEDLRSGLGLAAANVDAQFASVQAANDGTLIRTTIESVVNQQQFTIPQGARPNGDKAINGRRVILVDADGATNFSVGSVLSYDASSGTIRLERAPRFTIAAGDGVTVQADAEPPQALALERPDYLLDPPRHGRERPFRRVVLRPGQSTRVGFRFPPERGGPPQAVDITQPLTHPFAAEKVGNGLGPEWVSCRVTVAADAGGGIEQTLELTVTDRQGDDQPCPVRIVTTIDP